MRRLLHSPLISLPRKFARRPSNRYPSTPFCLPWKNKRFYLKSAPTSKLRASGEDSERRRKYVVENKYNEVTVIRCATQEAIEEAMQKLGEYPHVCVAGVSNAGKSSMINHLIVKKNLARASSVPGKTKTVDLFLVNDTFVIADFPGMPSTDPQVEGMWKGKWRPLIKSYMTEVKDLRGFVFIHDIRWPVAFDEIKFNKWMRRSFDIPNYLLLLSKNDKVEHNRRLMGLNNARNKLGFEDSDRHLHYCSQNENSQCRASRRHVLRWLESVLIGDKSQLKQRVDDLNDPL